MICILHTLRTFVYSGIRHYCSGHDSSPIDLSAIYRTSRDIKHDAVQAFKQQLRRVLSFDGDKRSDSRRRGEIKRSLEVEDKW